MKSIPPKIEAVLALGKTTALETLGVEILAIDEVRTLLSVPITPKICQPAGLLHGGISMFLAETAASLHCAYLVDLTQVAPVGIEINGSHLSSAAEGTVRAEARVLNRARSLIVHEVNITLLEEEKLLTRARVTNYLKRLSNSSCTVPL